MHIEQKSFPRYFSATTGWNSTKLYGNLQYQEKIREDMHIIALLGSDILTQSYGP
jgi:hypothetical protein